MPAQLSEKPSETIRDLLVANWNPSNTNSYDPTLSAGDPDLLPIHYGNYDSTLPDPQISITNSAGEDNTIPGIDPGGGGATWIRAGDPIVQCWAEDDVEYNGGLNAEDTVENLRLEAERIIHANTTGAGELLSLTPIWEGRFPDPDDVASPKWQDQMRVTYTWLKNHQ